MNKIFFVGLVIGLISRLIMLNINERQYPTQPNILASQVVLAFVSSSLGALLIPALISRSYTSITFLSLAAEQFRKVRENRRDTLRDLESSQLVSRGGSFIEEIAKTYEVRNYLCIVTSFMTVGCFHLLSSELKLSDTVAVIVSTIAGLSLAYFLRRVLSRDSIDDIAEVSIVDIEFVEGTLLKVGDLKGITNVGLKKDRERYLEKGIGIKITPRDKSYINAGILSYPGQRQAICYNLYSRLGIYKEENEPSFTPIPRMDTKTQSLYIAFIPIERDEQMVIEAVKSCPILESSRGRNIALKHYKINGKKEN